MIHLQLWEQGYLKEVPIFFRKRGVLSRKPFQRVFGQTSMFSAALWRQGDFGMKPIYGKCYQRLSRLLGVNSLFMILVGCLILGKLFT